MVKGNKGNGKIKEQHEMISSVWEDFMVIQAHRSKPIFVFMSSKETIAGNNMKSLIERTELHLQKIFEGGGKKAIAKQKEKNQLVK